MRSSTSWLGPGESDPIVGIQQALSGDEVALTWLVDRATPPLKAHARHRLGKYLFEREGENTVQETWLFFCKNREQLRANGFPAARALMNWLCESQTNLVNNFLRRDIRTQTASSPQPSASSSTGSFRDPLDNFAISVTSALSGLVRSDLSRQIDQAIALLSEEDRAVFVLRALEGFSNQEVANELEEQPNTVAQRYLRILVKLRRLLPKSLVEEFIGTRPSIPP